MNHCTTPHQVTAQGTQPVGIQVDVNQPPTEVTTKGVNDLGLDRGIEGTTGGANVLNG